MTTDLMTTPPRWTPAPELDLKIERLAKRGAAGELGDDMLASLIEDCCRDAVAAAVLADARREPTKAGNAMSEEEIFAAARVVVRGVEERVIQRNAYLGGDWHGKEAAWQAVCGALDKAAPEWLHHAEGKSAIICAEEAIAFLAQRAALPVSEAGPTPEQVTELVQVWMHDAYSAGLTAGHPLGGFSGEREYENAKRDVLDAITKLFAVAPRPQERGT